MSTCEVFLYPMCPSFILSCPVGLRSTIRCVICSFLLCSLVMWSFIIYVLSYFICLVHADCFLHSMCHMFYGVMSNRKVVFYPVCPVIFSFVDSECFLPFDLSYAFLLSCPPVMCPFMLRAIRFTSSCAVGSSSLMWCAICFRMPCLTVMCSFIRRVLCFTLCFPFIRSMCHHALSRHVHPRYVLLFHVICFQIVLSIFWPGELFQVDGQNVQSQFTQHQVLWYTTPLHPIPVTPDNFN